MSNFIPIYYLKIIDWWEYDNKPVLKSETKSLHAYIRKDLIETVDVDTEATDKERETYVVKLSNGQTFHNVMDTSTELFEYLMQGDNCSQNSDKELLKCLTEEKKGEKDERS